MRNRGTYRGVVGASLIAWSVLAAGCSSTIHDQDEVGGINTLSVDAKQRMMLVGNRGGISDKRVACTEPMPDAIVARAAVLAGGGNVNNPNGISGGAELAGGSSEAAASIGFRDHTVQMLRDGYFRLCEAYMNGALTKEQYQHMIMNADTFMVVVSALQILGSNPVAPAVTISAGGVSASATAPGGSSSGTASGTITPPTNATNITNVTPTAQQLNPENARMAAQIVHDYLIYRRKLFVETHGELSQSAKWDRRAQPE